MIQLKVYPREGASNDETTFLDLYETQPIKLTLSIEDVTSADATSVFSKTFKVPATRDNNEFFENAWDIDGILFDITIKKPAEILVDGAEFKIGHVRLQKIYTNDDLDKTDYELLFLGETRDFSSAIGEKRMCELVMTDFSWTGLPVNYTNAADFTGAPSAARVIQSWNAYPEGGLTQGLADGDLLHPLIDHGNLYDADGNLNSSFHKIALGPEGFTSSSRPIAPSRLKPMIRAKRIWDQIFQDAGYTYESQFLDSNRFKHMYTSAFGNNESTDAEVSQASDSIFTAQEPDNNTNDVDSYLFASQTAGNSGGAYNIGTSDVGSGGTGSWIVASGPATPTSYYLLGAGGEVNAQIENSDYGYSPVGVAVQLVVVSAPGGTILQTLATGNYATNGNFSVVGYDSRNGGYQIQAGDIIQVYFDAEYSYDWSEVGAVYFNCLSAPGNYYAPNDLDCEYNQIDYIKDVITMFRLVMQPDPSRPNHFIIEPWQDFIGSGKTYDWSDKLVKDKDFISEPLFNTQSSIIEFTAQEDEDFINSFHQDNTKHAYGWLRFDSNNELLKGKREIELTGIAPTPIDNIVDEQGAHSDPDFILPQIVEYTGAQDNHNENERLPIKAKTRFMFYNGLINTSSTWYMSGSGSGFTQYPLVSPYEKWPIVNTPFDPGPPVVPGVSTLNLNFANDTRYFLNPTPGTGYSEIPQTLFDEYWSRYISSLYNKFTRRITATFILNNVDLQDLTFDDVIFVDGKYYRPEKIIDAQVGQRTAVKVQLITLKDRRPVWLDEALTGFSITTADGTCAGQQGSIQVTTNGTPPFDWQLGDPANITGFYNDTPGNAPYIFTIPNVPIGTDTLIVTDNFGRTAQAAYTINASNANPITANWTETDATDCTSPCNGAVTVVASGGSGTLTIHWQDPNVSGFTPTGLCPGDYYFYIQDADGCQSDTFLASISCSVVTYVYQLRENLSNCSQSSSATYIASSSQQLANLTQVDLNERNGCYYIQNTTTQTPQYTIGQTYATCQDCNPITPVSYQVQTCGTGANTYYVPRTIALSPGQAVELQTVAGCFEVVGDSTNAVTHQVTQVFATCADCTSTPPGFIYLASFCSGLFRSRYFASTIALSQGSIMEIADGTFAGECVEIQSQNNLGVSSGNIDVTQAYINCAACQGTTPQVCHNVGIGSSGATLSWTRGSQSFGPIQYSANTLTHICANSGSITQATPGSATITPTTNSCTTNLDCTPVFRKTSCHTLNGGTSGSSFNYQDSGGVTRSVTVATSSRDEICAVINTVVRTSGNGSFSNNNSLCLSNGDCDSIIGPPSP